MAIYLIGYDLNKERKEGKDYDSLYTELKSYGTWWHHLDSTWLIKTDNTIASVYKKLKPHIHEDDTMLVIEITSNNYNGWMTEKASKWLDEKLPKPED